MRMEIDRLTLSLVLGLAERAPVKHPQEAEARRSLREALAATSGVDAARQTPDARADRETG